MHVQNVKFEVLFLNLWKFIFSDCSSVSSGSCSVCFAQSSVENIPSICGCTELAGSLSCVPLHENKMLLALKWSHQLR